MARLRLTATFFLHVTGRHRYHQPDLPCSVMVFLAKHEVPLRYSLNNAVTT